MVKKLPAMQETQIWSLGQEDPLKKGMATYSSILAWRIPWTDKPGNSPWGCSMIGFPCPSPTLKACSNSCPLSRWCHPTISSSVLLFSSLLQSFPPSWYFPVSQFFTLGGQSIWASASVLPMNIQDWYPFGLTGWISLKFKGHIKSVLQHHNSKVLILQHAAFFMVQLSHPYVTTGKTSALTRGSRG